MNQIRVALLTGNYNHIRDGVSLTLNRWVNFLLQNNAEVLVFGPTITNPPVAHNGTLISVPSIEMPGRPEYRITMGFPEDAKQKLEDFNPDIVHIATPDLLGYKGLKWAIEHNIPVVSSFHTHFTSYLKYYKLSFIEPIGWKYLKWFYEKCEQVYVPSKSMIDELESKNIDGNFKVWARGVEIENFNPDLRSESWRIEMGFKKNDIVVTFVSRLVWEKNLQVYADVLNNLQKEYSNVKALIVGDGPAMEELKEMIPDAAYTGFLKGRKLSIAYASSDIFFFPSESETFGNVTLEAMSSGLPCVVADAAGSKSLIVDGENGFLAEANDKERFRSQIEKLVLNSDLRNKMGGVSTEKAKGYSWKVINKKLLSYYGEVLQKKIKA
ncbi:MAG: glycosyltransferase family 1 protein [Balneolaceae bacterium]